jgi:taurine dioxygenase
VVLPGQFLTPAEQHAAALRFGEILTPGRYPTMDNADGVMQLENQYSYGTSPHYRTNRWHTDATHLPRPPSFTMISCEQPAPLGGDTIWANQYLAYDTLSDDMKKKLHGLQLNFLIAEAYRSTRNADEPEEIYHPVIRVHGETGRKSLYFGDDLTSTNFSGMTRAESSALKAMLFQHSQRPEHVYRHRWRKGDLVIWDNRCSMHYAVLDYDPKAKRTMHRVMVAGEVPIAAVEPLAAAG